VLQVKTWPEFVPKVICGGYQIHSWLYVMDTKERSKLLDYIAPFLIGSCETGPQSFLFISRQFLHTNKNLVVIKTLKMEHLEGLPRSTGGMSFIRDSDKHKTEKPYKWTAALEASKEHLRTNISLETRDDIVFRDIRSLIDSDRLSVREHGFQILRHPSIDHSVKQEDSILEEYVTGLVESVKEATSAEFVCCVNFVVSSGQRSRVVSLMLTVLHSSVNVLKQ
jgi:hypothetical protein